MISIMHLSAAVRRLFRRITTVVAISGSLSIGCAGMAAASTDLNMVVGLPDAAPGSEEGLGGRLDIRRPYVQQLLDENQLGIPRANTREYARFGAVIVIRDLNGDGYDDMVVGAPGKARPRGQHVVGQVNLLFGSQAGITKTGVRTIRQPQLTAGDLFGAALALSVRSDNSGIVDLWIGAPNHEVNTRREAGAIYRYAISPTGKPKLAAVITQAGPMVPNAPEAGDHFGAVMADHSSNRIVVGVPDEDIGYRKDAGTVVLLRTDRKTNALVRSYEVSQNSEGVFGVAEAGDHFGAALTVAAHAVGIPGEDVGIRKNAGAVQTFGPSTANCRSSLRLCPSKAFTQNSSQIPNVAETGDRFGAALSEGIYRRGSTRCSVHPSVAIGSPGEDLGKAKDAGSVTSFMLPAYASRNERRNCAPIVLRQGKKLPGFSETGDQAGATLSTVPGDEADGVYRRDLLVTGVPGENRRTAKDAGQVLVKHLGAVDMYGGPGRAKAGQRYGSVLASYQAVISRKSASNR